MDLYYLNKKIGIIGGGQLGKMMILEAKKLGLYVTVLDPSIDCPASSVCDNLIVSQFSDRKAMLELANCSDVITYEFEHIDYTFLIELANKGYKVYPNPNSLKIIQNKYTQKCTLKENKIPVPRFSPVKTKKDIENVAKAFSYPLVLKSCTGGYDGKGNFIIKSKKDICVGIEKLNPSGDIPLMVEEYIDFSMEVSVLACGDVNGSIKVYPICNNTHIDNILHQTIAPASLPKDTEKKVLNIAYNTISVFKGIGIFCAELFVTKDGDILLNEIAPRPHNSGHYTIEGCHTSQFANHIRAICELPLGSTELISPSVMINLLGEDGHTGDAIVEGVYDCLSLKDVFIHIYGKSQTKPKRKMGHITCLSDSLEDAICIAENAFKKIKIVSK